MRFARHKLATAAIALLASAPLSAAQETRQGIEQTPQAPSGDELLEIARSLCVEAIRRRFGIDPDDVTGHSFGGGGDSRDAMEGSATISLYGPPSRDYRCEIVRARVTTTAEIDAEGNSVRVEPVL